MVAYGVMQLSTFMTFQSFYAILPSSHREVYNSVVHFIGVGGLAVGAVF